MTQTDLRGLLLLIDQKMKQAERLVPARLQAALALLERLRSEASLDLGRHLTKSGHSIKSQETLAQKALERFDLPLVNKTSGRRSSNLHDWAPDVLAWLDSIGFEQASSARQTEILEASQQVLAERIRQVLEVDPLKLRVEDRTAEFAISDVLDQAAQRGKVGDVAQYLVGAKLHLRFPERAADILVSSAFQGNRRSHTDAEARLGDFEFSDCIFEVASGRPDEAHLDQVATALAESRRQFWLLVRSQRLSAWRQELIAFDVDLRRVVVASIEQFVGQNLSELGECSSAGTREQIENLIQIYHESWVGPLAATGIDIEIV
ncbi:MAG: DUF4928 family protein [Planctomycetota bacterium]